MITVKWGKDDKSILQYEFEDTWTIDDLIEALDAGVAVTHKYDHNIDVVVDLLRSGLPNLLGSNINKAFQKAMNRTEEHIEQSKKESGIVVIVSNHGIMRATLSSLLAMYGRLGDKILLADSIAQAHQQIAQLQRQRIKAIPV